MKGSYVNYEVKQKIEPFYIAPPLLKLIRYNDP